MFASKYKTNVWHAVIGGQYFDVSVRLKVENILPIGCNSTIVAVHSHFGFFAQITSKDFVS